MNELVVGDTVKIQCNDRRANERYGIITAIDSKSELPYQVDIGYNPGAYDWWFAADELSPVVSQQRKRRAYDVLYKVIAWIAYPNLQDEETYLEKHFVSTYRLRETSKSGFEYLRRLDFELAEIAFNEALDIMRGESD